MTTQDSRNYSDGEILSFVVATNEAAHPERLIGLFTPASPGIRAHDQWHPWASVRSVQRVPIILDPARFVESTIERVRGLSPTGLAEGSRKMLRQALTDAIDDLSPLPPEPPQWTTVKVTYSNPVDQNGWHYYTRDADLPGLAEAKAERWMGPGDRVSWADLQKMGTVEILPRPKDD